MKKREEIEEIYKWNLDEYALNISDCVAKVKNLIPKFKIFENFRGNMTNKANIFACLDLSTEIERELYKCLLYGSLRFAENSDNAEVKKLNEYLNSVAEEYSLATTFINVELSELSDDFLCELSKDKSHPQYDRFFELLIRAKRHILSQKEEELLAKISAFTGGFSDAFDMFDSLDVKFQPAIDKNGKKHELNHSTRAIFRNSPDEMLRKTSYVNYLKGYENAINTISTCYINSVKQDCVFAKIKNYENALSSALEAEEITSCVYQNLVKKINENTNIIYNYIDALKLALGLKNISLADFSAPIITKIPIQNLPYESALKLVNNALLPLGDEYQKVLKSAEQNGWIDVFASVGKDTGQFSNSTQGAHPVVCLRYEGNYDSVSTIAHEMGHAMHSYFSSKTQAFEHAFYPIFLAEIASTTNEVLLNDYFSKTAKTSDEKLFYLNEFLGMVQGTIFRQTQFAEFEEFAHKKYETDKILTKEDLNAEFKFLNEKYYGNGVEKFAESNLVWAYVPHFYNSFYVYKYATGLISAIKIASGILNNKPNAKENYLKFLSSGSSKPPLETLKLAGVDLEDETTFDDVFEFINGKLAEFKALSQKKI